MFFGHFWAYNVGAWNQIFEELFRYYNKTLTWKRRVSRMFYLLFAEKFLKYHKAFTRIRTVLVSGYKHCTKDMVPNEIFSVCSWIREIPEKINESYYKNYSFWVILNYYQSEKTCSPQICKFFKVIFSSVAKIFHSTK